MPVTAITFLALAILLEFATPGSAEKKPSPAVRWPNAWHDNYVCGDGSIFAATDYFRPVPAPSLDAQIFRCQDHGGLLAPTEDQVWTMARRMQRIPGEFDAWCDRVARYSSYHGLPEPACRGMKMPRATSRPCPAKAGCS
jgi:hypothetical protein